MQKLPIQEVEYTVHQLARQWMTWGEPIPDMSTRFPGILESCLAAPFQAFGGKSPYRGMPGKAAALFYFLIKNHPFQNGNKRIAVVALLIFLFKNKKWMDVDNIELYNFAKWVAGSPAKVKTLTIAAAEDFIRQHLVSVDEAVERNL